MNRRELLKMVAAATGGVVIGGEFFLAGCKNPDAGIGTSTTFTESDIAFLDEVAETIFPKTSTPGAKEAKVGQYMTVMVNDCYDKKEQDAFHAGMKSLNEACNKMHGHDFMKAGPEHRKELLVAVDKERGEYQKTKKKEDPNHYFQAFKQLTIMGYFTSKEGREGATRYEPIPGKYIGDYDYKKGDKIFTGRKLMEEQFDAIVIGSGISGGWAAKELCDKGLKVLLLERGRDVVHLKDYPTATKDPWQLAHRGEMPPSVLKENPIVAKCYAFGEATEHFFVKDKEHPYIQEKPFDWIRAYQVGGKSLLWARQVQRWSKFEFDAPARDGYATPWPVNYDDMAPWYSHVEKFAGISGNKDGLENLPDGEFLPPWDMNVVEKHLVEQIKTNYPDRPAIIGRCAHLTQPQDIHIQQGRQQCQARSLCERGCPFGGYFSSNASTIPWAQKSGNLTLKTNSVVHSIIYDDKQKKATGVKVINAKTKEATEYSARIIFVNAACINTNLILLNSRSDRFPNGLGNDNGLLGKFICFHNYRGSISATYDGFENFQTYGRRPTMIIMPSFRNVRKQEMPFKRGYLVAFTANRYQGTGYDGIGAELKDSLTQAGAWGIYMMMQGETIPKETNHVRLSTDKKDDWGIPQLITSVDYDENDELLVKDFHEQGVEMLTKAGCKNIYPRDSKQAPGLDIHEMGGVRMGKDPKTSMLNKWNQFHNCPNVFVTDGACMTSTGTQNPSLTFMAITARAANYAAEEFKKGNL